MAHAKILCKLNDTKFRSAPISTDIARFSKTFGPTASFVAFDALATPVPTACGDLLFVYSNKK